MWPVDGAGQNEIIAAADDALYQAKRLQECVSVLFQALALKIDDPGLKMALASDCFYVGALGSRKTHGKRVERLMEAGFTQEQVGHLVFRDFLTDFLILVQGRARAT